MSLDDTDDRGRPSTGDARTEVLRGVVSSRAVLHSWFEGQPHFAELSADEQNAAIDRFVDRVRQYGTPDDVRHKLELELADALEAFQEKASRVLEELDEHARRRPEGLGGAYAVPEAVRVMRERMPWMLKPSGRERTKAQWTRARALATAPELATVSAYRLAHAACVAGIIVAGSVSSLATMIDRARNTQKPAA